MVLMENFSLQQTANNNENDTNNDSALVLPEDHEKDVSQPLLKTISIEEYKNLMQLMIQVKKYEETIEQMGQEIKLKDAQLKCLRNTFEEGQCIKVCHLSNVSIRKIVHTRRHQLFHLIVHSYLLNSIKFNRFHDRNKDK